MPFAALLSWTEIESWTSKFWSSPIKNTGCPNSARIIMLMDVSTITDHTPNMKYKVPVSQWFVENGHRFKIGRMAEILSKSEPWNFQRKRCGFRSMEG